MDVLLFQDIIIYLYFLSDYSDSYYNILTILPISILANFKINTLNALGS